MQAAPLTPPAAEPLRPEAVSIPIDFAQRAKGSSSQLQPVALAAASFEASVRRSLRFVTDDGSRQLTLIAA
jgi:hypothetical protein